MSTPTTADMLACAAFCPPDFELYRPKRDTDTCRMVDLCWVMDTGSIRAVSFWQHNGQLVLGLPSR